MTKATERRSFWRAVFHSPVRLLVAGAETGAHLLDISLKGALLEPEAAWNGKAGDECRLCLDLAPDVVITMETRVMHVEGAHVGLHCTSIDLDSITHLRRLVELNSGDPAVLDRELASLVREARE